MNKEKDGSTACNAYGTAAYAYNKSTTLFCDFQDVSIEKGDRRNRRMAGVCACAWSFLKKGGTVCSIP